MALRIWNGGRPVIEYLVTVTIGGTWVAGETLSVTIDGLALTLTIGTDVAVNTVASNLKKAWEGEALDTAYAVNFTGTQSGRHYELIASVASAVVSLTERPISDGNVTEGKTFPSLSVAETSTSGTITLGTPNTPTGPYDLTNAANFAGGAVLADTDTLEVRGPFDIRYGLDQSAVLTTVTVIADAIFAGQIGLPRLKSITLPGGFVETFEEYRPQYFKINSGGTLTLSIGFGDGDGLTMAKFDANQSDIVATIHKTGTAPVAGEPAVFLNKSGGGALYQYGGTVGLAFQQDTGGIDTNLDEVYVSSRPGESGGAILVTGQPAAVIVVASGVVKNATATLNHLMTIGEVWVAADNGIINVRGPVHSDAKVNAYGGLVNLNTAGGTLGTVNLAKGAQGLLGAVVIAGGLDALTITNCTIYSAGCNLTLEGRRAVTFTNDIVLTEGLGRDEVTVDMPLNTVATKVVQKALP